MKRKTKVTLMLATLLSVLAAALVGIYASPNEADAQVDTRPNIVFFITDDLDTNLLSQMPAFQESLEDGAVSLDSSYVADPFCCPSRTSILTGLYVSNHGIRSNSGENGGAGAVQAKGLEDDTIAYALKESGYTTSLVGKYLNGNTMRIPDGWSDWHGWVGDLHAGDYTINNNGTADTCRPADCHNTDYLARRGEAFIDRQAGPGRPFFLYMAVNAPHDPDPEFVAPRYKNELPNLVLKKTPAFAEKDVTDKPRWVRTHQMAFSDGYVQKLDENQRNYARSMLSVRDAYNDLVAKLKATGEYENTLIVFTSDHGKFKGDHGLGVGKRSPYLHDVKVPTYIEGGAALNITPHRERRLVSNIDYYATFAELAGLPPRQTDGTSLTPLLDTVNSQTEPWRDRVFVEGYAEASANAPFPVPTFRETITATETYTEYGTGEVERYDLTTDRWQLENLASGQRAKDFPARSRMLDDLARCDGTECRRLERMR